MKETCENPPASEGYWSIIWIFHPCASAYLVSQDIKESELETERDTLMPEKTTAVTENTPPPVTTSVPLTETTTTERTPVITTYTHPSVITLPADSLDEDAEWAEIE